MKTLILSLMGIFLVFTSLQANAMAACSYSKEPCDDKGNHFRCVTFGWVGDFEFCSSRDVGQSSQNQIQNQHEAEEQLQAQVEAQEQTYIEQLTQSNDWFKECIADCMATTGRSRNWCAGSRCW